MRSDGGYATKSKTEVIRLRCLSSRTRVQAYFLKKPLNFGQLFLMTGNDFFHCSFVHVSWNGLKGAPSRLVFRKVN